MEAMSKQDKEISKSANTTVVYESKTITPIVKHFSDDYKNILKLIDITFGLPKKYTKIMMYDYVDRPDILVNIWIPDPSNKSDVMGQNLIISYRYENGKVSKP